MKKQDTVRRLAAFFGKSIGMRIARQMQYRFNFIVGNFIALAVSGVGPVVQYLIFSQTRGYPGWTLDQIVLFQGVLLLSSGLNNLLFADVKQQFMNMIWKGDFDRLLLLPLPVIGIVVFNGFNLEYAGSILAGIAIIVFGTMKLAIGITIGQIALFLLLLITGCVVQFALNVLFCAIGTRLIFMGRIRELMDAILTSANFPLEVFPHAFRFTFMFVVPFAVITVLPAQVLLARFDITVVFAMGCALLFLGASLFLWQSSLKRYSSGGG